MKALEGGQKMQEEKGTMLKKTLEEELKKDPLTLALISEELSRYGININREGAKDFVNFNLKVRLISQLVLSYIFSVILIISAVVGTLVVISAAMENPELVHSNKIALIIRFAFFFIFVGGFAVFGILLFINARKLHKALFYNKKTGQ